MNKIKKNGGGEEEVGNEKFQIPRVKNGEARRIFCEFLRKSKIKNTVCCLARRDSYDYNEGSRLLRVSP